MEQLWLICGIVLAVIYIFDKHVIRFEWNAFKSFFKILAIGSILSIVFHALVGGFPQLPPISVGSLFFVWWEDVLFSLLLIYYAEKSLPRWAFITIAVLSSLVFGSGHLYQGYFCAAILSLYPYFISYKLGKKYGYSTVMLAHVTYDFTVLGNAHLAEYLRSLF